MEFEKKDFEAAVQLWTEWNGKINVVSRKDINDSAADFLEEPIVVCRASGTCVTPKDCKRK